MVRFSKFILAVLLTDILLTLLMIDMFALPFTVQPGSSESTTIIVPDDHAKIWWAIGNASNGDTIYIRAGYYDEYHNGGDDYYINKTLTFLGENVETTTVYSHGMHVLANDVRFYNLTMTSSEIGAINVVGGNNLQVANCRLSGNQFGLHVQGGENHSIKNCELVGKVSVGIQDSTGSVFIDNRFATIMTNAGVSMVRTDNTVFRSNTFQDSAYLSMSDSNNNTFCHNSFTWGITGPFVIMAGCANNAFYHNTFSWYEGLSIIIDNNSANNAFYHNTFSWYESFSIIVNNSTNAWDNGYPSGGNYWSDYNGTDLYSGPFQNVTGSDGIADSSYVIDGNSTDKYPLMTPSNQPSIIYVPSRYPTIQEAIDAATPGDTIFIRSGTYGPGGSDVITVNKPVSLVGENPETTGISAIETRILANDISIRNLTISSSPANTESIVVVNAWNFYMVDSISNGQWIGLDFVGGGNHTVVNCQISGKLALVMTNCKYNLLKGNSFFGWHRIGVTLSDHSDYNVFVHNSFLDGYSYPLLRVANSVNNSFNHNNFFWSNEYENPVEISNSTSVWDSGYPSGGNYWSDHYEGVDEYKGIYQNESGSDGISDTPYFIAPGHIDSYPFMYTLPRWEFDISLSEILPEKTIVGSGYIIPINVTAQNKGFSESPVTFNLTVEATRIITAITRYVNLQGYAVQGWNSTIPGPTIIANVGDIMNLTLEGIDNVHHKFYVDYNGNAFPDVNEPQSDPFINSTIYYSFNVDQLGNYTYYCAYNQATMYGTLSVSSVTPPSPLKIASSNVTLAQGEEKTVTFDWNTSSYLKGNYTINAYATPILGEWETTDNSVVANKEICITIVGDIDGDWDVDIFDIVAMAGAYGSGEGELAYNPNLDIDGDGDIDIFDIVAAASHYGESW